MKGRLRAGLAGVLGMVAMPVVAQVADDPATARTIRDLGPTLNAEVLGATSAIYNPLLAEMDMSGIEVISGQRYGDQERNVLDVYRPVGADNSQPVVIFAHGGGFVRGDKAEYSNVAAYLAQNGVVGIVFNYRLAPEHTWPSGAEDVAGVMAWIRDHPEIHGGDSGKVFVGGASAGSAHAADYAFREELQIEDDGMIGVILISPPNANLTDREIDPNRDALYYGTDTSRYEEMSYLFQLEGRSVPVMLAYAELDLPLVQDQSAQLIQAFYERDGRLPVISTAVGHNHYSIGRHIGSGDETLGPDLLEFVQYVALFAPE